MPVKVSAMKITTKMILMITFSLFLTSAAISALAVISIKETGRGNIARIENFSKESIEQKEQDGLRQIEQYREQLYAQKKEYLKSQVQTATGFCGTAGPATPCSRGPESLQA